MKGGDEFFKKKKNIYLIIIKNFFVSLYDVFKKPSSFTLFFLFLPLTIIIFFLNFFFTIFFIIKYFIFILYYYFKVKNFEKIICIGDDENKTKSAIVIFLKKITTNYSEKLAFNKIYNFLNFFSKFLNKSQNNKNDGKYLKYLVMFLHNFIIYLLKFLLKFLTGIPFIVLEKNIIVVKTFLDCLGIDCTAEEKVLLFFYNIIIKITSQTVYFTHNKKIIINKNNKNSIFFNPNYEELEMILKNIQNQEILIENVKTLLRNYFFGVFSSNGGKFHLGMYNLYINDLGEERGIYSNETSYPYITKLNNDNKIIKENLNFKRDGSLDEKKTVYQWQTYDSLKIHQKVGFNKIFLSNFTKNNRIYNIFGSILSLQHETSLNIFNGTKYITHPKYKNVNELILDRNNSFKNEIKNSVQGINYFYEVNKNNLDYINLSTEDKFKFNLLIFLKNDEVWN